MKNNNLVVFRDVSKIFNSGDVQVKAVDNINFEISNGEFVVILGASGAGKTTILNLLGGMDRATSGTIIVNENIISEYSEKSLTLYRRNEIGFVFQFYNLISNLSSLENVEFASSYAENPFKATEILNKVGLEKRFNNFPSQLSGGEQQRVAIARAVAKNPTLLLCDEPTGALDYITGKEVLKLLDEINRTYNKTILVITHNIELAKMADKVIKIKSGAIEDIYINNSKLPVDQIEW
jgi:putative ABC transport system ATP-binding protein